MLKILTSDPGAIFSRISKMLLTVSQVNWRDPRLIRSGIIPYILHNNTVYYCFGIEPYVGALTDFGGHYEQSDTDLLDSAIREYSEECFGVFGTLTRESMQNYRVILGQDTNEILVPVENLPGKFVERFRQTLQSLPKPSEHEIQDIVWLSHVELYDILANHRDHGYMYARVRNTLVKLFNLPGFCCPESDADRVDKFQAKLLPSQRYVFNSQRYNTLVSMSERNIQAMTS